MGLLNEFEKLKAKVNGLSQCDANKLKSLEARIALIERTLGIGEEATFEEVMEDEELPKKKSPSMPVTSSPAFIMNVVNTAKGINGKSGKEIAGAQDLLTQWAKDVGISTKQIEECDDWDDIAKLYLAKVKEINK